MSSNPPVDVQELGQSIWVDNIRRKLLEDGTFQDLIDNYGIVGVTSNPSIFQKAIGESDDYDDTMKEHLDLPAMELYELLAIQDIQTAADLFRPIYDATDGKDGFVSLEVSPFLAHDTAGTIEQAQSLYDRVNRPNVMIKIPATEEGIPAIEESIAAGININVTLIFSVENYVKVAHAYIRGLERRLEAGKPVTGIASVASFFLSRIDSMVDGMLNNNILAAQGRDLDRVSANNNLLGKTAVANAKIAYKRYQEIFEGPRFATLREAGAAVQRPLWASTSTKNPAYPDTMYVDSLIGKNTVNTMPPSTLEAFKDHGTVSQTLTVGVEEAADVLRQLPTVGVELDNVTQRLQDDGVDAFAESFESLLTQVESKRIVLSTGVIERQKVALGINADAVKQALKDLDDSFANGRMWNKDGGLWKDHNQTITKINNRLGWLDIEKTIDIETLKALQAEIKEGDFEHVVLLGMGGSSLAPEVFSITFGKQEGYPNLLVLDSTVPERVIEIEEAVDLSKTVFIVASKSGGTIETLSFYKYFYERTGNNGKQFIAITDEGSKLQKIAEEQGFYKVFINPSDIGGRYSALSYFGLVPAAMIGLDMDKLWERAQEMMKACGENIASALNPGAYLGALAGTLAKQGRDKLTIYTSPSFESFGNWVEQLVAESTGKENVGIVPVVGATIGKPSVHATDRTFVYIKVMDDPANDEIDEQIKQLREAGHPRITLRLRDKYDIAGEFFRWEYATSIMGKLLDINPFDEPNVTESKQNTGRLLDYYEENGKLPEIEPLIVTDNVQFFASEHTLTHLRELCTQHGFDPKDLTQVLAAMIIGTHAGDYFALLAYLPQTQGITDKLEEIRVQLRQATNRAVTIGFGPRYLHSTGQLHKGGANNGVFIQLTHDDADDREIPEAPYSFGTLKSAQAAGDLEALEAHDRRSVRLHFANGVESGLELLLSAVKVVQERRS